MDAVRITRMTDADVRFESKPRVSDIYCASSGELIA